MKTPPRQNNISCITAVSNEKLLGFQLVHGGVDGSTFGCFLLHLLRLYPDILNPTKRYCFVLDNATIHHAKKLKNLLSNLKIFYLAPYSPFNNPIEEVFAITKFYYRRMLLKN